MKKLILERLDFVARNYFVTFFAITVIYVLDRHWVFQLKNMKKFKLLNGVETFYFLLAQAIGLLLVVIYAHIFC